MLQSQIGRKTKKTDEIQFFVVGFRRRTIVASSQGIVVIIAVIYYSSSVKHIYHRTMLVRASYEAA